MGETFPTRRQVFNLRKDPDVFEWTCDTFLPHVVGVHKFNRLSTKVCISDDISRSDEAFMLLVLDNNWARWTDMVKNGGKSDVATKYTQRGRDAKKYGGWSLDGLKRYNLFMKYVEKNRQLESASEVENKYVRHRLRLSKHPVGPEDDEMDEATGGDPRGIEIVSDLFGKKPEATTFHEEDTGTLEEWLEDLEEEDRRSEGEEDQSYGNEGMNEDETASQENVEDGNGMTDDDVEGKCGSDNDEEQEVEEKECHEGDEGCIDGTTCVDKVGKNQINEGNSDEDIARASSRSDDGGTRCNEGGEDGINDDIGQGSKKRNHGVKGNAGSSGRKRRRK